MCVERKNVETEEEKQKIKSLNIESVEKHSYVLARFTEIFTGRRTRTHRCDTDAEADP